MARLRRSDTRAEGITRRRRGKGFSYFHHGKPVTDADTLERIRALVIPPAWRQVWICLDPQGHLQATGVDDAGRRQYRYHDQWRIRRDAAKFSHMLEVAEALPRLRKRVAAGLAQRGLNRERVLAAAARLLDSAVIRTGGEGYANDDPVLGEATFGLATLRRSHVSVTGDAIILCFQAKGGTETEIAVRDRPLAGLVRRLLGRDDPNPELLGFREGGQWRDVRTQDVNDYLREASGIQLTAKDFRTWHGTVAAAVSLAHTGSVPTKTGARKAVTQAMRDAAELLGNTAAVARKSYVDPRVIDAYVQGETIAWPNGQDPAATFSDRALWAKAERATLALLNNA